MAAADDSTGLDARIREATQWHRLAASDPELAGPLGARGRSCLLQPPILPRGFFWPGPWRSGGRLDQEAAFRECALLVEDVVRHRRHWLEHAPRRARVQHSEGGGRLLLFQPQSSTRDCLAMSVSAGVVDEYDEVGWDWWVGVRSASRAADRDEGGVVAWIPGEYVAAVDAAVHVNPMDALRWVEMRNVTLLLP